MVLKNCSFFVNIIDPGAFLTLHAVLENALNINTPCPVSDWELKNYYPIEAYTQD